MEVQKEQYWGQQRKTVKRQGMLKPTAPQTQWIEDQAVGEQQAEQVNAVEEGMENESVEVKRKQKQKAMA